MDDVEMYKSYKGHVTELHIVDQYMMEVQSLVTWTPLTPAECWAAPSNDAVSLGRVVIRLPPHSHSVRVITGFYHSFRKHVPACLAVIWPMCAWLKVAGGLADEQQDQPTVQLSNVWHPA